MNPTEKIHETWKPIMNHLYVNPLNELRYDILPNISSQPQPENIFRAFEMPVDKVKVVILGQDPYPTPGDATGFAFEKHIGRKIPVSLRNIFKELHLEGLLKEGRQANLRSWTDQGVFLLNTALTVETGRAGSHLKYWKEWTKAVINYLSRSNPCIWIMWGKKAQAYIPFINGQKMIVEGYDMNTIKEIPAIDSCNYILKSPHPAAEAYAGGKAGFYGNNHFIYTNEILKRLKKSPIRW